MKTLLGVVDVDVLGLSFSVFPLCLLHLFIFPTVSTTSVRKTYRKTSSFADRSVSNDIRNTDCRF